MLFKPLHQGKVVGQSTQQAHRAVGVAVDETRQQSVIRPLEGLPGLVTDRSLRGGQQRYDPPVMDGDAVILARRAVRLHRDDPAGVDQGVDFLHAW